MEKNQKSGVSYLCLRRGYLLTLYTPFLVRVRSITHPVELLVLCVEAKRRAPVVFFDGAKAHFLGIFLLQFLSLER